MFNATITRYLYTWAIMFGLYPTREQRHAMAQQLAAEGQPIMAEQVI